MADKKKKKEIKKEKIVQEAEKKEEQQEKQEQPNAKAEEPKSKHSTLYFIIFAGVLLIIFLGIIFIPRYMHQLQIDKYKYHNFEFVKKSDGFWYTMVQKNDQPYWVPFYYHPSELEDIGVEMGLRNKFFEMRDNNGSIYITLDPDAGNNTIVIAGVEIARITGNKYDLLNVPTRSAFIKEPSNATVNTNTPIITCRNSNSKTLVVWLTLSDNNVAYSYDYCVMLEAKTYNDMVRVADRVMYHLLGIMD